jgi:hypothetical protein
MKTLAATVVLALAAASLMAAPPADWRLLKDRKGNCQVSVPRELQGETSAAQGADRKTLVTVHGSLFARSWDDAVATSQKVMKPVKTLESGPSRVLYTYDPGSLPGGGKHGLYVAVPGPAGVAACTAQVQYDDPTFEATARAIAESLSKAR